MSHEERQLLDEALVRTYNTKGITHDNASLEDPAQDVYKRQAAAGGIGGHMYASSVSKGGNFANNVIGSVATGSISQMGSISGEKAAEALHSYMGYAALESGAENVPTFQNVEIGGGRMYRE